MPSLSTVTRTKNGDEWDSQVITWGHLHPENDPRKKSYEGIFILSLLFTLCRIVEVGRLGSLVGHHVLAFDLESQRESAEGTGTFIPPEQILAAVKCRAKNGYK